jgi:hypothetical protein
VSTVELWRLVRPAAFSVFCNLRRGIARAPQIARRGEIALVKFLGTDFAPVFGATETPAIMNRWKVFAAKCARGVRSPRIAGITAKLLVWAVNLESPDYGIADPDPWRICLSRL